MRGDGRGVTFISSGEIKVPQFISSKEITVLIGAQNGVSSLISTTGASAHIPFKTSLGGNGPGGKHRRTEWHSVEGGHWPPPRIGNPCYDASAPHRGLSLDSGWPGRLPGFTELAVDEWPYGQRTLSRPSLSTLSICRQGVPTRCSTRCSKRGAKRRIGVTEDFLSTMPSPMARPRNQHV